MTTPQIMETSFDNMFKGTCLESIKSEFSPIAKEKDYWKNEEIYWKFHIKCLETLKNKYKPELNKYSDLVDYVKKTYGLEPPVNNNAVEQYSRWSTQMYYLVSLMRTFEDEEKKDNTIIELVNQLQKYGLYKNFDLNRVKKHNIMKNYDTEKLKKELEENQNAEKDAEKILKDENHLNYLGGYSSEEYKKYSRICITEATRKLIQPEIDRRIMERKIDAEARRRIYEQEKLQKELEEKQKFEDAVHKRINELGK